jgi:hypothetical protein
MAALVRRVAPGLVPGGAFLGTVVASVPGVLARTLCESSYPEVCSSPATEIGDLDCIDIRYAITVNPPDSHGFDANCDSIGCESCNGLTGLDGRAMGRVSAPTSDAM